MFQLRHARGTFLAYHYGWLVFAIVTTSLLEASMSTARRSLPILLTSIALLAATAGVSHAQLVPDFPSGGSTLQPGGAPDRHLARTVTVTDPGLALTVRTTTYAFRWAMPLYQRVFGFTTSNGVLQRSGLLKVRGV